MSSSICIHFHIWDQGVYLSGFPLRGMWLSFISVSPSVDTCLLICADWSYSAARRKVYLVGWSHRLSIYSRGSQSIIGSKFWQESSLLNLLQHQQLILTLCTYPWQIGFSQLNVVVDIVSLGWRKGNPSRLTFMALQPEILWPFFPFLPPPPPQPPSVFFFLY